MNQELVPKIAEVNLAKPETDFIENIYNDVNVVIGDESAVVSQIENLVNSHTEPLPDNFQSFKTLMADTSVSGVVVRGLELPLEMPDTPELYQPAESAEIFRFDFSQLVLSSIIGASFGTTHVRGGRILCDVFPKQGYETKSDSAFGSDHDFDFHVDGVVHPDTTPDVFSLHCLRNILNIPTLMSDIDFSKLSLNAQTFLTQNVFRIYYESISETSHSIVSPIIRHPGSKQQTIHYYGKTKVGIDETADDKYKIQDALDEFDQHLQQRAVPVSLTPGEIMFVNNRNCVHGRPAFSPSDIPKEKQRWLKRLHTATRAPLVNRINEQGGDRILVSRS